MKHQCQSAVLMTTMDGAHISVTQLQQKRIPYGSTHGAVCSDITVIVIMDPKLKMANLHPVSTTSLSLIEASRFNQITVFSGPTLAVRVCVN
jgi:hypothetical protein